MNVISFASRLLLIILCITMISRKKHFYFYCLICRSLGASAVTSSIMWKFRHLSCDQGCIRLTSILNMPMLLINTSIVDMLKDVIIGFNTERVLHNTHVSRIFRISRLTLLGALILKSHRQTKCETYAYRLTVQRHQHGLFNGLSSIV